MVQSTKSTIMFPSKEMPSPSSLFSAYASMAASMMLIRSMANELIPQPIRGYLVSTLNYYFKPHSAKLTLVIEENCSMSRNQVYDAAEIYLCTKISPNTERLKISKSPKEKNLTIRLEKGEKLSDAYEGVEVKWRFVCAEAEKNNPNDPFPRSEKRFFELSFQKKHKEKILNSYVPFILDKAKDIKDEARVLKMYTLSGSSPYNGIKWESINLEHPATFETLAMDPERKNDVIEDLNRFVKRKEFYKRVGRAWKRGYLLYGPPGTGKSSLIAAMANHLRFDIYDLQLANIVRDSDLRKLLLATANRSILVIEDIDCSVDLPDRRHGDGRKQHETQLTQLTLSGLLNFIDGLWSSCGDERIIVFTTNHKERLDPALLRPGRMDMHIHMSYCTFHGFKQLASTYLGIRGHHHLFVEIQGLIDDTQVTPAQVAEELMKSEHADIALQELIKLLKRKKIEDDEADTAAPPEKNLGFRAEESTVTEQSGGGGGDGKKRKEASSEDESSKMVSSSSAHDLNESHGKRMKQAGSLGENEVPKAEVEASSAAGTKLAEESTKLAEPPKQDYIHVRARRGQATDSHSLAERARREKISERMKILQDLVPGCNKVIGKALVLDEIINYIQSLQRQVEFLSMKLEAVNSRMSMNPTIEGFPPKDLGAQPFDASGMMFGSQATREYAPSSQPEWLHMQVGGSFERAI